MPADKAIANGIAKGYAGDDRESTVKMLQRAAAAARADERARIIDSLSEVLREAQDMPIDTKVNRFKKRISTVLMHKVLAIIDPVR